MAFNLRNRSFLKELDFSTAELGHLVMLGADLKAAKYSGFERPRLRGKEIALIFEKTSTRTRTAFEFDGLLPTDRRTRTGRRPPDRRARQHRRHGRLVLLPQVRLAQRVRALLDRRRGGHCRIRPARPAFEVRQLYFPDTAILITRFMTDAGTGEVVDFMVPTLGASDGHRLFRMLRCVRGRLDFQVEVAPRFYYGRRPHRTHVTEHGAGFDSGDITMTVHAVREPDDECLADMRVTDDGDVHGSVTLNAGQVRGIVLETGVAGPHAVRVGEVEEAFDATVRFWHSWLARSPYRGRWREALRRSAITLKLMTYAPTGAIIAAPRRTARTARRRAELGLPVHVGQGRVVRGELPESRTTTTMFRIRSTNRAPVTLTATTVRTTAVVSTLLHSASPPKNSAEEHCPTTTAITAVTMRAAKRCRAGALRDTGWTQSWWQLTAVRSPALRRTPREVRSRARRTGS